MHNTSRTALLLAICFLAGVVVATAAVATQHGLSGSASAGSPPQTPPIPELPGNRFVPVADSMANQPDPVNGHAVISRADAITAALKWASLSLGPDVHAAAWLGHFSDSTLGVRRSDGTVQPTYTNDIAYTVAIWGTGVNIPETGGPSTPQAFNHEQDVVIDATTGDYMEAFNYR